jgi:hypothetical protein
MERYDFERTLKKIKIVKIYENTDVKSDVRDKRNFFFT